MVFDSKVYGSHLQKVHKLIETFGLKYPAVELSLTDVSYAEKM